MGDFLFPFVCIIVGDDGIFVSQKPHGHLFCKKHVPFKPFQPTKRKKKKKMQSTPSPSSAALQKIPARGADFRLYDGLLSSFLGDLVDGNSDLFLLAILYGFGIPWDSSQFCTEPFGRTSLAHRQGDRVSPSLHIGKWLGNQPNQTLCTCAASFNGSRRRQIPPRTPSRVFQMPSF